MGADQTATSAGTDVRSVDVAVVGAGPAGLQAAIEAGAAGASVVVVDGNEAPGGQYHRPTAAGLDARRPGALHHGWRGATARVTRLRELTDAEVVTRRQVWGVSADAHAVTLHTTVAGAAGSPTAGSHVPASAGGDGATIAARALILATGAVERVLPFPGWDLPGVLTAGGAQALLKGQAIRPGRQVVVAGAGPLLLPVASALVRVGTEVVAVCDAGSPRTWLRGGAALASPRKAAEAAGYLRVLAAARVPYRARTAVVRADGDGRVETATLARLDADWRVRPGSEEVVAADAVCVSVGFAPAVELAAALGCELTRSTTPAVVVDPLQRSTVVRVYVAGEATGIAGAAASVAEGGVAGLTATRDLGLSVDRRRLRRLLRRRAAEHRFAAALERATPVGDGWAEWLEGDTLVCRCEEAPYQLVRDAIDRDGAHDPRSVKMTTRCGMGYCQGRICSPIVAELLRLRTGAAPADAASLVGRPIATPVRLGDL